MKRIKLHEVKESIFGPLIELNTQLQNSSLTAIEYNLIYARAAQINGCAYCTQSHIEDALKAGESQHRVNALTVWRDSGYFNDVECIILQMTEEITNISVDGLADTTYNEAIKELGEAKVADVIMAIACINAWTRVGRATLLPPKAIN